jgi:hypothetical protein
MQSWIEDNQVDADRILKLLEVDYKEFHSEAVDIVNDLSPSDLDDSYLHYGLVELWSLDLKEVVEWTFEAMDMEIILRGKVTLDGSLESESDIGEGDTINYPSEEVIFEALITALYDQETEKIYSLQIEEMEMLYSPRLNNPYEDEDDPSRHF